MHKNGRGTIRSGVMGNKENSRGYLLVLDEVADQGCEHLEGAAVGRKKEPGFCLSICH